MINENLTWLCSVDEVPEGKVKRVELGEFEPLAVYQLRGEFYVTSDTCTHGEAPLSDGEVEGEEIVCAFHFGAFNIKTGQPERPPCVVALRTYPAKVIDGAVFADLRSGE